MPINETLSLFCLYDTKPMNAPIGHRISGMMTGKPCILSIGTNPKKKFKINSSRTEGISIDIIPKTWLFCIVIPPL